MTRSGLGFKNRLSASDSGSATMSFTIAVSSKPAMADYGTVTGTGVVLHGSGCPASPFELSPQQ